MTCRAPESAARRKLRRVAIAGVFDIANYGDQLFPLIAAHRLGPHGIDVTAVAPSMQARILPDAISPRDIRWLLSDPTPIDGILIGGGNIIYNLRVDYLSAAPSTEHWLDGGMHTGIWLAAATAAALRDIPFAFNAPGVPYPFSAATRENVLSPVMHAASYLAVRDTASAALLPNDGSTIHVVPDTAIDIAAMWPKPSLDAAWMSLRARKALDATPHFVVHVRCAADQRHTLAETAARLDEFASAHGLKPLLLAIGNDLGDGASLRALASSMRTPAIVLDDPVSLKEMAAALANAALYIGGSLHGYVTSLAYHVPGVIVTTQMHRKFSGFLSWAGRPEDLTRNWDEALTRGSAHLRDGVRPTMPADALAALQDHWDRVVHMLNSPMQQHAERARLLRALISRAASRVGPEWAMAAWACRPDAAPEAGIGVHSSPIGASS